MTPQEALELESLLEGLQSQVQKIRAKRTAVAHIHLIFHIEVKEFEITALYPEGIDTIGVSRRLECR